MDAITEPADGRLEMGGNNPPGKIELERAAQLIAAANQWMADRPEITDTAMAAEAQAFVDQLRTSKKELGTAQKADLAPHDEAIDAVKAKYRDPLAGVEAAMKVLLEKSGAWLVKERARLAAEKAAQEAEAKRLREEADRLEREAREAAAKTEISTEDVAVAATAAHDAAKDAKAAERVADKKVEAAAIKSDSSRRAMTLRATWRAEVVDESAAIESYKDHPTVRKAALAAALQVANEAARTSKDETAAPLGFRFFKEERAQ